MVSNSVRWGCLETEIHSFKCRLYVICGVVNSISRKRITNTVCVTNHHYTRYWQGSSRLAYFGSTSHVHFTLFTERQSVPPGFAGTVPVCLLCVCQKIWISLHLLCLTRLLSVRLEYTQLIDSWLITWIISFVTGTDCSSLESVLCHPPQSVCTTLAIVQSKESGVALSLRYQAEVLNGRFLTVIWMRRGAWSRKRWWNSIVYVLPSHGSHVHRARR